MLSGAGQDWTGPQHWCLGLIFNAEQQTQSLGTGIADIKDIGFPYNTFYFH